MTKTSSGIASDVQSIVKRDPYVSHIVPSVETKVALCLNDIITANPTPLLFVNYKDKCQRHAFRPTASRLYPYPPIHVAR